jgi:hypothetical protein
VKTVEVRVSYPRMRKIRAGDRLTFAFADERVPTWVTECRTFDAMLDRGEGRCSAANWARTAVTCLPSPRASARPRKNLSPLSGKRLGHS